jgi:Fe2+ transport system protein B
MLGSLRLPFFFQDFDAEGEKTSIKILKGMGRFDGHKELSQDTITRVMLNSGLRARLQEGTAEEKAEIELIRDALLEAKEQEKKSLQEEIIKKGDSLAALALQKKRIEEENVRTKKQKEEAEEAAEEAALTASQAKAEAKAAHEKNLKLKTELSEAKDNYRKKWRIVVCGIFTLVGILIWWFSPIQDWAWFQRHPHMLGLQIAAHLLIPALAWIIFGRERRFWVFGGIVIGVLLVIIQII